RTARRATRSRRRRTRPTSRRTRPISPRIARISRRTGRTSPRTARTRARTTRSTTRSTSALRRKRAARRDRGGPFLLVATAARERQALVDAVPGDDADGLAALDVKRGVAHDERVRARGESDRERRATACDAVDDDVADRHAAD